MIKNIHLKLLCVVIIAVILYPCYTAGTFYSYDAMAHFERLGHINAQIGGMQFPPLFDYYSKDWYGYSWNMFYPPLSSYIMMILRVFTTTEVDQFKLSIATIIIISFICMYFSALLLLKNKNYAAIASILFITSGYLLSDAYIRIDIGELLAMAFTPLLVVGAIQLVTNKESKFLFPLSISLILLSNIPSFIACIIYLVFFFALNIKAFIKKEVIFYLFYSIFVVVLSTLFFTVPLIYHFIKSDVFAFHGLAVSYNTIGKFGVDISEMAFGIKTSSGMTTPGILISSGLLINILYILSFKNLKKESKENAVASLLCVLMLLASTSLFPWYMVSESIPLIRFIQFPWRLMILSTTIMSLFAAKALLETNNNRINIFVLCLSAIISFYPMQTSIVNRAERIASHSFHDYMTIDFEKNKSSIIPHLKNIKSSEHVKLLSINGSTLKYSINQEPDDSKFELPIMAYDGYNISIAGKNIVYSKSEHGLIEIHAQKGDVITVRYSKYLSLYPLLISTIFIFLFIPFLNRNRKKM